MRPPAMSSDNFDSLWMHLLVAYHRTIVEGRHAGIDAVYDLRN